MEQVVLTPGKDKNSFYLNQMQAYDWQPKISFNSVSLSWSQAEVQSHNLIESWELDLIDYISINLDQDSDRTYVFVEIGDEISSSDDRIKVKIYHFEDRLDVYVR